jgi:3-hydroxyacyl-CoA dehydrogenase
VSTLQKIVLVLGGIIGSAIALVASWLGGRRAATREIVSNQKAAQVDVLIEDVEIDKEADAAIEEIEERVTTKYSRAGTQALYVRSKKYDPS